MNATSTTPTRPRGRPARPIAPAAAHQPAALDVRSLVYLDTAPRYSDGADVEAAYLRWREHLDMPPEQIETRMANALARLAEVEAALAEIDARKSAVTARLEECRVAAAAAPAEVQSRKADAAAGLCSLDDLAVSKARADMARELLPAFSAAHTDLANEHRDLEKAHSDARRAVRDLEAARAWQALRAALAPVQDAIAKWLEVTGDAAVFIGTPAAR